MRRARLSSYDLMSDTVNLPDGAGIEVRAIAADDDERLRRFHARLSSETVYLRFFTPHPELSTAEATHFTHVDHRCREAVVAVSGDDIVGVARFDRLPRSDDAETAVVVEDAWQGRGVGSALLRSLADRAVAVGVRRFVADVLARNGRMLRLLETVAPASWEYVDDGVVRGVVSLERASDPGLVGLGRAPRRGVKRDFRPCCSS